MSDSSRAGRDHVSFIHNVTTENLSSILKTQSLRAICKDDDDYEDNDGDDDDYEDDNVTRMSIQSLRHNR